MTQSWGSLGPQNFFGVLMLPSSSLTASGCLLFATCRSQISSPHSIPSPWSTFLLQVHDFVLSNMFSQPLPLIHLEAAPSKRAQTCWAPSLAHLLSLGILSFKPQEALHQLCTAIPFTWVRKGRLFQGLQIDVKCCFKIEMEPLGTNWCFP